MAWGTTDLDASVEFLPLSLPWWLREYRICPQCRRPRFSPWVGKDPLEKDMATHSSILAWRVPWIEEPGRLLSMGPKKKIRHDCATFTLYMRHTNLSKGKFSKKGYI